MRMRSAFAILALASTGCLSGPPVAEPSPGPTTPAPSPAPTRTSSPSPTPTSSPTVSTGDPATGRNRCGDGAKEVRFRIEIGDGVDHDAAAFGRELLEVYCDDRGWLASGSVRFRWDQRRGGYLIRLLTREGIREHCGRLLGQPVSGDYSCAGSAAREINLHADRWFGAVAHWTGGLDSYRAMVANHEMGHALTLRHVACPAGGARAPVMMQQSISLTQGGRTCRENPWPRSEELARIRAAWG